MPTQQYDMEARSRSQSVSSSVKAQPNLNQQANTYLTGLYRASLVSLDPEKFRRQQSDSLSIKQIPNSSQYLSNSIAENRNEDHSDESDIDQGIIKAVQLATNKIVN